MFNFNKFKAFTLAEVLITLGIIGVVAALTVPTLMNNIQDRQYKSAYKKAYSALNQAVMSAIANDELVDSPTTNPQPNGFQTNFLTIMSKFKVTKACTSGSDNADCWDPTGEKYGLSYSTGYPTSVANAFIDSSGMAWTQYYSGSLRTFVDTNGFKKPNQWGKDRFVFSIPDSNGQDEASTTVPIRVMPVSDNHPAVCFSNACGTVGNKDYQTYYSKTWLSQ